MVLPGLTFSFWQEVRINDVITDSARSTFFMDYLLFAFLISGAKVAFNPLKANIGLLFSCVCR